MDGMVRWGNLEALARQAMADASHLDVFFREAVPAIESLVLAESKDLKGDTVANALERFRKRGALAKYPDWQLRNPEKTFRDWFSIVVANARRDALRKDRGRGKTTSGPTPKQLLNELALSLPSSDELGVRPPMTDMQTAKQLLDQAEVHLSRERFAVLSAWLSGQSFEEIGARLGCAPIDAAKSLRASVAVLRRLVGEQ